MIQFYRVYSAVVLGIGVLYLPFELLNLIYFLSSSFQLTDFLILVFMIVSIIIACIIWWKTRFTFQKNKHQFEVVDREEIQKKLMETNVDTRLLYANICNNVIIAIAMVFICFSDPIEFFWQDWFRLYTIVAIFIYALIQVIYSILVIRKE